MRAALLTALLLCGAAAVTAQECDASLAELRDKLAAVQAKLEAAEESSTSCSLQAGGLKDKLSQAEDAVAASAKAVKGLEARLEAAAKESLAATERQLSEASAKLAASEKKVDALQAAVKDAKSQADSCASRSTDLEGAVKKAAQEAATKVKAAEAQQAELQKELAKARAEIERVRSEAASARSALEELQRLKGAWLPHWAEQNVARARAAVGPALEQGVVLGKQAGAEAAALWRSHGTPAAARGWSAAKGQAAALNKAIEAKVGDRWPQAQAAATSAAASAAAAATSAYGAASRAATAAWHSDALAAVRPTLAAGAARAQAEWGKVQAELEEMLIRLLSGSNSTAPFARRPYVTYMVHAALAVPLVTLGLPLLGLRRGGSRVRTGESTGSGGVPMSTKRRKHKAGHKH